MSAGTLCSEGVLSSVLLDLIHQYFAREVPKESSRFVRRMDVARTTEALPVGPSWVHVDGMFQEWLSGRGLRVRCGEMWLRMLKVLHVGVVEFRRDMVCSVFLLILRTVISSRSWLALTYTRAIEALLHVVADCNRTRLDILSVATGPWRSRCVGEDPLWVHSIVEPCLVLANNTRPPTRTSSTRARPAIEYAASQERAARGLSPHARHLSLLPPRAITTGPLPPRGARPRARRAGPPPTGESVDGADGGRAQVRAVIDATLACSGAVRSRRPLSCPQCPCVHVERAALSVLGVLRWGSRDAARDLGPRVEGEVTPCTRAATGRRGLCWAIDQARLCTPCLRRK
ncbi:hypothetical protein FKP32DRAFT_15878 [Trametes sanguinea]|nr:hypothetical protein FKP32DRAFT_15878 [Trametes sanguinea]